MSEIMWKLGQVSGMLEGLASMEGGVISSDVSRLLMNAVEALDGIADELTKQSIADELMKRNVGTGRNVPVASGFIRMDE